MAHTELVPTTAEDGEGRTPNATRYTNIVVTDTPARKGTSHGEDITVDGLQLVQHALRARGIPPTAQQIVLQSWRQGTQKQYRVYLKKWASFCHERQLDPHALSVELLVEFLAELFDTGLGYSALGTARSAISALSMVQGNSPLGENPLIKRFFKGVFNMRPTRPRYAQTWDVNVVLNFMRTTWPLAEITLKNLTLKLVMLIALVTGQRGQSLHLMYVNNMVDKVSTVEFRVEDLCKTSRPGALQPLLVLPAYEIDIDLCVVATLHKYLQETEKLHSNNNTRPNKLFISFARPHMPISKDTLARWIRTVMTLAGIDTKMFKAHSTRAASTSAALRYNVPLDTVLSTAGWTNAGTFAKFYNKQVVDHTSYGKIILENCQSAVVQD